MLGTGIGCGVGVDIGAVVDACARNGSKDGAYLDVYSNITIDFVVADRVEKCSCLYTHSN